MHVGRQQRCGLTIGYRYLFIFGAVFKLIKTLEAIEVIEDAIIIAGTNIIVNRT